MPLLLLLRVLNLVNYLMPKHMKNVGVEVKAMKVSHVGGLNCRSLQM